MTPGDLDTGEKLLTAEDVAGRAGIGLRTWHAYVARGRGPKPDGQVGRTPVWLESTIDAWVAGRGQP